ncbi:MAG: hypothetical protein KJ069_14820 [Anaerolineae bacterium]|nr:hypothetical protein [Anaerolineae bacterium]
MHTYYFRSIGKGIFLLLLGLCLIGLVLTQESTQPQTAQAAEDVIPRQTTLTLAVTAPEAPVTLGEEVTFWVEVTNTAVSPLTGVTLMLPGHHDLVYLGAGDYELADNIVRLGDMPGGGAVRIPLRVGVQGLPANDISLPLKVWAVETDSVDALLTLHIQKPAAESADLGTTTAVEFGQGLVSITGEEMKENGRLQFQLHEQHQLPAGDAGTVLAFSVTPPEGAPADTFTAADLHLNITDLVNAETRAAGRLRLYFRPTGSETWAEATFSIEAETGTLTTTGMGFGEYLLLNEPEPWEPSYNPPGASAYSGAAQFSYGIDVPPGVGGLTPSLGLSYGSRSLDEKSAPSMAFGFGLGWGMPQAEITNGNASKMYDADPGWNACVGVFNNRRFTLALNGTSYVLEPVALTDSRHGQYIAIGDPSIKVEYISAPGQTTNVAGEFWRVQTADGTTYQFGFQPDAEQVIAPLFEACYQLSGQDNDDQPRNRRFMASSWKLDTITDKYGNQVRYTYEGACGQQGNGSDRTYPVDGGGSHCTEVDVALKEIRYNFGSNNQPRTVIEFQNGIPGNTEARKRVENMLVGLWRPGNIIIKQDGATIRRYNFNYATFEHRVAVSNPYGYSFWWITDITQYGVAENGSEVALPTLTFTYDRDTGTGCGPDMNGQTKCIYLLTQVENGYGAVSKIAYETFNNNGIWNLVKDVYTWDGVAHIYNGSNPAMVQTRYDRTGAIPCFDNKDTPGCRAPHNEGEDSDKLVGFDRVTITAGAPANMPGSPMSKQGQTFNTSNYWLNGKVSTSATYDPNNNAKLTESISYWTWVGNEHFARLDEEENKSYAPDGSGRVMGSKVTYGYDPQWQGSRQWGRSTHQTYFYLNGSGNWTAVRRTNTFYLSNTSGGKWLLAPWTKGLYREWTELMQATLYYYDNNINTYPANTQPLNVGKLTMTRVLLADQPSQSPPPGVHTAYPTVDTAYLYDNYGNVTDTTIYNSYGEVGYNTPGGNWHYGTIPNQADGRTTHTEYTSNGWLVSSIQNPLGQQTNFSYNDNRFAWQPTQITDVNNNFSTYYQYDPFGRLYQVFDGNENYPNNPLTRYMYWDNLWNYPDPNYVLPDGVFAITTKTRPEEYPDPPTGLPGDPDYAMTNLTYYDGLGRVFQQRQRYVEVGGVGMKDILTATEFDALGRAACTAQTTTDVTIHAYVPVDCMAEDHTSYTYDALGRQLTVTAPDESQMVSSYDVTTNITVAPYSRLARTAVTDANGHTIANYTNALGELVLVRNYDGNNANYLDTQYWYNTAGNLIAVSQREPLNSGYGNILMQTNMSYDALGRKLDMDDPDMGAWEYSYDPVGNLLRQEDANGNTLCFYYDKLNRLVRKIKNQIPTNPCPALSNAPASGPYHLASYSYFGLGAPAGSVGQLQRVSWGPEPTSNFDTFTYDSRSRLTRQERVIDGRLFALETLTFDSLNRPLTVRYPDGKDVTLTYDGEGEDTLQVTGLGTLVDGINYNARGQMTTLSRPAPHADTVFTYYGANDDPNQLGEGDSNFRLKGIQTGSLLNLTYSYDLVGNIMYLRDDVKGDMQSYTYDHLYRLKTAEGVIVPPFSGCSSLGCYNHTYNYNRLGNLTSWVKDGVTLNYNYPTNPTSQIHAVTSITNGSPTPTMSFNYDDNGNMTSRTEGLVNFSQIFDVENRLTHVIKNGATTRFDYDASGQRVKTTHPDGSVVYYPFANYEVEIRNEGVPPPPSPTPTTAPPTPTNTPIPTNTPTPSPTPITGNRVEQAIWRNNQGWTRMVPVVGGQPDWNNASAWSGPVGTGTLPGSGNVEMLAGYVVGNTLHQGLWRGNQGWSRTVPIENGWVNWGGASTWSGPVSATTLPGSGTVQSLGGYRLGNILYQSMWRGTQGWTREVPIVSNQPDWNNASAWAGPVSISNLPGSGSVNSQADFIIGNTLWQAVWRGNQGWARTVPIEGGVVNWNDASNWSGPTNISTLPGSGDMQAHDAYFMPPDAIPPSPSPTPTNTPVPPTPTPSPTPITGNRVEQAIWRNNQGWTRMVPVVSGQPDWNNASAWSGPTGTGTLPGSGNVEVLAGYVVGSTLHQGLWRGNQGWSRTVPIVNGAVNWGGASTWSGPVSATTLPGSGTVQSLGGYRLGNILYQSLWRGDQGWTREVPVVNNQPDWNNASAWSGPVNISNLPGSGSINSQADFIIGNTLWQSVWRGNQGWMRTVPIVSGVVNWGGASNWSGPTNINTLPGSGDMQAQDAYYLLSGGGGLLPTGNTTTAYVPPTYTAPPAQPGLLARLLAYLGGLVDDFQVEVRGWLGTSRPLADNTAVTTRPIAAKQGPENEFADIKPAAPGTPSPPPPPPVSEVMGEVGLINDTLTHAPQTIILSRSYQNPVVFAQPISRDETNTAVARITNVQADRFTLYVHEAPNQNGNHTTEAVSYMVLEAGVWELPGGVKLEVGKQTTAATVGPLLNINNQWAAVQFSASFGGQTPVIISQVQTNNDPTWVKTRQTDRSATGFKVALEGADVVNTPHGAETIGWLAITPANGNWNGRAYQAANTGDVVTSGWTTISFNAGFSSAPRFLAGIATYDEADGAALRYSRLSLTSSGVQVMVEEDTTGDSETTHTSEVVSYVAIQGNGTLTAVRRQTVIQRTTYRLAGQAIAVKVSGSPADDGLYYLHSDHLGSASVLSNASGGVVPGSEARYLPFGDWRTEPTSNPGLTDMGFTGHKHNNSGSNDLGLIYMNARYYVPGIGRFASADTIVPDPAKPQSYNRYSYVYNNPLMLTDPSGHNPCPSGPGYYECTRNFYGLDEPDVTESEASEIFDDMADESDIPFAFPADGCYGRAHRMIQRIAEKHEVDIELIEKVSIEMTSQEEPLSIMTNYVYPGYNDGVVQWGWHVAPLLDVEMEDGRVVPMVIDPSLFKEPVTIEEWASIMHAPNADITIRERHWFTPGEPNLSDEKATERTEEALSYYLALCRDAGYCQ